MSVSSTRSRTQFRTWVGQASNLDRCVRCSAPRSAHGPDWSCPAAVTRPTSAVLLITGILLAGVSLILHSAVGSSAFAAESAGFLIGVNLIIASLTTGGR
jgi:hypothetical protein